VTDVTDANEWYWCLEHQRAESADQSCPPDRRMGPYSSADEAQHWREKVEARNEAWDEEDRRWEGEDE
jgi:hypothetical protein